MQLCGYGVYTLAPFDSTLLEVAPVAARKKRRLTTTVMISLDGAACLSYHLLKTNIYSCV